jgi:hypothetical protein
MEECSRADTLCQINQLVPLHAHRVGNGLENAQGAGIHPHTRRAWEDGPSRH